MNLNNTQDRSFSCFGPWSQRSLLSCPPALHCFCPSTLGGHRRSPQACLHSRRCERIRSSDVTSGRKGTKRSASLRSWPITPLFHPRDSNRKFISGKSDVRRCWSCLRPACNGLRALNLRAFMFRRSRTEESFEWRKSHDEIGRASCRERV